MKENRNQRRKPVGRGGWAVTFCLLGAVAFPPVVGAVGVTGDSATYVRVKKVDTGNKTFPVIEYLNLSVSDANTPSFSFHAGGWGRLDLSDQGYDSRKNGDLHHAYLLYRGETANAQLKLGRLTVFEGVAAETIDGLSASTDFRGGLSGSFFLGKPVQSSPDKKSGDLVAGLRLAHSWGGIYTLGVSALQEKIGGDRVREEGGVDLTLTPHRLVTIAGRSVYNSLTDGWSDNSYTVTVGPWENVTLGGEISKVNYRDALSRVTSNAFSFSPSWLRIDEDLLILGDSLTLEIPGTGSIAVDYRNYNYTISGTAHSFGIRGNIRPAPEFLLGSSVRVMSGATDRLDYTEVRLYGQKKTGHLDLTGDIVDVKYRTPINDVSNTYAATIACGYEVSPTVKVGADGTFYRSPEVSNGFDLLAKVQVAF